VDISDAAPVEILAPGKNLRVLLKPPHISKTNLFPIKIRFQRNSQSWFLGGEWLLRIHFCSVSLIFSGTTSSTLRCVTLKPDVLKLIPNPISGRTFPVPGEATDESEGTVLYETGHVPYSEAEEQWIGIKVDGADGQGWIAAGLSIEKPVLPQ